MVVNKDIRWHQRYSYFTKALSQLSDAVKLSKQKVLAPIELQGLIKSFEFTHELAWNVMKDFFENQGNINIYGSRDATREAFHRGLIVDGDNWMKMISSRNETSHTYNESTANEISDKVNKIYFPLFVEFSKKMQELKDEGK